MSDELLPCPFCGGHVKILGEEVFQTKIYGRDRRAGGFYFQCQTKGCECTLGYAGCQEDLDLEFGAFDTGEIAVRAWNTRINPTAK